MDRTHANSVVVEGFPQYAHALAILSGGIAFSVTQLGYQILPWLVYALLAALFASLWPGRALYWGGWLCLPIFLLIFLDLFTTGSLDALLRNGTILARALPAACLGAYLGSKLSIRRIPGLFTSRRVKRIRLQRDRNLEPPDLDFKEPAAPKQLAAPRAIAQTSISSWSNNDAARALLKSASIQDLNDALIKAAQEGDLNRLKLLLADGANVNARSSDQLMAPMLAGLGGDAEIKSLFGEGVAAGAFDVSGNQGWTALMIATIAGRPEVVRALLEHGARVSAEDENGWTALRFAVSMDETEILQALLDAGADVNIKDHEGKTALMQAASENICDSLNMLLKAGADPLIKDDNEQTALMMAQKQGHTRVIKLLKEAEARVFAEIDASFALQDDASTLAASTHRVIRKRRDKYYGLIDRYEVVAINDALPSGCEETGREGNEEECWEYALKNSIDEPSELAWWLGFSSKINA